MLLQDYLLCIALVTIGAALIAAPVILPDKFIMFVEGKVGLWQKILTILGAK